MLQISYVILDKVCLCTWFFYPLFSSNPIIIKVSFHLLAIWQRPDSGSATLLLLISPHLEFHLPDFNDIWLIYHLPPLTIHCHFQSQIRYLDNKGRCSVYSQKTSHTTFHGPCTLLCDGPHPVECPSPWIWTNPPVTSHCVSHRIFLCLRQQSPADTGASGAQWGVAPARAPQLHPPPLTCSRWGWGNRKREIVKGLRFC